MNLPIKQVVEMLVKCRPQLARKGRLPNDVVVEATRQFTSGLLLISGQLHSEEESGGVQLIDEFAGKWHAKASVWCWKEVERCSNWK